MQQIISEASWHTTLPTTDGILVAVFSTFNFPYMPLAVANQEMIPKTVPDVTAVIAAVVN